MHPADAAPETSTSNVTTIAGTASGDLRLPDSCSPQIRAILAYWQGIRPAEGLPGRRHFDPIDVQGLLPDIWLMDVHRAPWRFQIRLVGTAIVRFARRDTTGLWCHDVFPDFENAPAYRQLVACAEQGIPLYCLAPILAHPDRTLRTTERIHLPLAEDGRRTDIILSLTRYIRTDGA